MDRLEAGPLEARRRPWARGSRRRGASCRTRDRHLALVHRGSGVFERGQDVSSFEVGIVPKNVVDCSPGSELTEHHAHRDTRVANRGKSPIRAGSTVMRSNATSQSLRRFQRLDPDERVRRSSARSGGDASLPGTMTALGCLPAPQISCHPPARHSHSTALMVTLEAWRSQTKAGLELVMPRADPVVSEKRRQSSPVAGSAVPVDGPWGPPRIPSSLSLMEARASGFQPGSGRWVTTNRQPQLEGLAEPIRGGGRHPAASSSWRERATHAVGPLMGAVRVIPDSWGDR